MKKKITILFLSFFILSFGFTHNIKLKISSVVVGKGKIVVSIHNSEESFKTKNPFMKLELIPSATEIETDVELSDGEYAFCVFHDLNSDGVLNSGFMGIPKEPFGFSNYNGKSVPGNFKKHKVLIDKDETIPIELFTM
ncbi:DUF2141 domain-containing protein [Treponema pectinovorum]|uniref:DUF2141 domain-containing protein n=1 Tax=Treponema pectinovorum TaxID=164 RepID=UPI0011F1FCD0|nr:DUF2141 domain-containing protein [Treponema pectinovorum]